jgi:hypothetical protein
MGRVTELAEMLEPLPEVSPDELEVCLDLVGKEAAFLRRLSGELKAGSLHSEEVPALLDNLAARLATLASPASPWRGIGSRPEEAGEVSRQ